MARGIRLLEFGKFIMDIKEFLKKDIEDSNKFNFQIKGNILHWSFYGSKSFPYLEHGDDYVSNV